MELRIWGPDRAVYPISLVPLYEKTLQSCKSCRLGSLDWNGGWRLTGSGSTSQIVFVVMSPPKEWAERFGPGHVLFGDDTDNKANEGVFLDALSVLGLRREDVYITNLVKCAAEDASLKSATHAAEIETCAQTILKPELCALQPQLVVATGAPAQAFLGVKRGRRERLDREGWPKCHLAGLRHPGWFRYNRVEEPAVVYAEEMRQAIGESMPTGTVR